jgi:hypothetical protein
MPPCICLSCSLGCDCVGGEQRQKPIEPAELRYGVSIIKEAKEGVNNILFYLVCAEHWLLFKQGHISTPRSDRLQRTEIWPTDTKHACKEMVCVN